MLFILLICLGILALLAYQLDARKYVSPIFITTSVLFISSLVYCITYSQFKKDISIITLIVVVVGLCSWMLGYICSKRIRTSSGGNDGIYYTPIILNNATYLLVLFIISFSYFVSYRYFMQVANSISSTDNILVAYAIVRSYYVDLSNLDTTNIIEKPFYLNYLNLISYALCYLLCYYYIYNKLCCNIIRNKYLLPIFIHLMSLFFDTGRMAYASFFIWVIIVFALISYNVVDKKVVGGKFIKNVTFIIILAFLLFKITGVVRGGAFLDTYDGGAFFNHIEKDLAIYVASPIYGLDYYLNNIYESFSPQSELFGQNTLAGIYEMLRFIGINIRDFPKHQQFFAFTSNHSNVYTGFKTDIDYYGIVGTFIYLFFIGLITGIFYKMSLGIRNLKYSALFFCFIGKLYYPIVFYFYVDDFYSILTIPTLFMFFVVFVANRLIIKYNT